MGEVLSTRPRRPVANSILSCEMNVILVRAGREDALPPLHVGGGAGDCGGENVVLVAAVA